MDNGYSDVTVKKHTKKPRLILIAVIAIIISNILTAVTVYFVAGFFKPAPVYIDDINVTYGEDSEFVSVLSAKCLPNVVDIKISAASNSSPQALGSGVIYSRDGDSIYVLTNAHVIETRGFLSNVFIKFYGNTSYFSTAATVVGEDAYTDIAVLRLKVNFDSDYIDKILISEIGNSNELVFGQQVIALGNSLGQGFSVTEGVVSRPELSSNIGSEDSMHLRRVIQHTASTNSGSSGGALMNMKGELIGLNTFKVISAGDVAVYGVNYALPINLCVSVAENIIRNNNSSGLISYSQDLGIIFALSRSDESKVTINANVAIKKASIKYVSGSLSRSDEIISIGGVNLKGYVKGIDSVSYAALEDLLYFYGTKDTGKQQLSIVINRNGLMSTVTYNLYLQQNIPFAV